MSSTPPTLGQLITMKTEIILETSAQSRVTKLEDGVKFRCSCCKAVKPVQTNGGTGYAVIPDGSLICYDCADVREKQELKDRSRPFLAYVSSDGNHITTWTGGVLARITQSNPCQLTRQSWTHGKSYSSIRCTDVHGGNWFGRGSPGICIKLRPCK